MALLVASDAGVAARLPLSADLTASLIYSGFARARGDDSMRRNTSSNVPQRRPGQAGPGPQSEERSHSLMISARRNHLLASCRRAVRWKLHASSRWLHPPPDSHPRHCAPARHRLRTILCFGIAPPSFWQIRAQPPPRMLTPFSTLFVMPRTRSPVFPSCCKRVRSVRLVAARFQPDAAFLVRIELVRESEH